ncbi:nuclear mRNA export, poly(A)+RNA binding protein [Mortierella sp. GBA30]|nr:nuclear mRNA export, poly(A)+RNA binding protein [Mortierella sp. GBA30]
MSDRKGPYTALPTSEEDHAQNTLLSQGFQPPPYTPSTVPSSPYVDPHQAPSVGGSSSAAPSGLYPQIYNPSLQQSYQPTYQHPKFNDTSKPPPQLAPFVPPSQHQQASCMASPLILMKPPCRIEDLKAKPGVVVCQHCNYLVLTDTTPENDASIFLANNKDSMQRGTEKVTGNEASGLFTAAGRDRLAGNTGGGSGGRGRRGGGGPLRDGGRRGGRRTGGLRGTSAYLPQARAIGREDTDGDMDMGEKKKNFSPYQRPGRNNQSDSSAPSNPNEGSKIIVFVSGKEIGNDTRLIDFLRRRASPAKLSISSQQSNVDGSMVSFVVPDMQQARTVKALSGIKFQGQKLTIKTTVDQSLLQDSSRGRTSPAPKSTGTIDAIRTFVQSRHNNGFLDLENMAADQILRAASIVPPGGKMSRTNVGPVMMKVAKELFPDITTISFASNKLRSLQPISTVAQYFPKLQNLSLKNNDIQTYKDIEYLAGKKLSNLRELILLENPVRDRDIAKNKDDLSYRSEITKLFPSLQVLDQVPVAPKISFGLDVKNESVASSTLPIPIRGNFYDSPGTQAMVLEFLTSFFKLFDTNRAALVNMYDNNATFSYAYVAEMSPLQKAQNKRGDIWNEYKGNRNMTRTRDLTSRTHKLHVGNNAIVQQGLMALPETAHDLSDASKVCVDAWQTGNLLPAVCIYINVHGEYEQIKGSTKGRKSFDRSFIIAPAPPNSQAAMNGWKCLIISDQLTIRNYNGSKAWQPEPEPNTVAGPTPAVGTPVIVPSATAGHQIPGQVPVPSTPVPQPTGLEGLSPEQQAMAQELQRQTGLNVAYSVQCLMAVNWDIANGVKLVHQERANIPQDAWITPPQL